MPKKTRYSDGYADFGDGKRIYDSDVAKLIRQHTHWWDRLDYHKMSDAAILAFDILNGSVEEPKKKKWFF